MIKKNKNISLKKEEGGENTGKPLIPGLILEVRNS
jgi:hypothetical protein